LLLLLLLLLLCLQSFRLGGLLPGLFFLLQLVLAALPGPDRPEEFLSAPALAGVARVDAL
jgi:hypothetical protein